jgi:hypothetical protein
MRIRICPGLGSLRFAFLLLSIFVAFRCMALILKGYMTRKWLVSGAMPFAILALWGCISERFRAWERLVGCELLLLGIIRDPDRSGDSGLHGIRRIGAWVEGFELDFRARFCCSG